MVTDVESDASFGSLMESIGRSPHDEQLPEIDNHHVLFSSFEQATAKLDHAIRTLLEIKKQITASNFSKFGMEMDHSFGKFDFLSSDVEPCGVVQTAPEKLSIVVKDCNRLGKYLGNLWDNPTKAEVDAAYKLAEISSMNKGIMNKGIMTPSQAVKLFRRSKSKKSFQAPIRRPSMPVIIVDPFDPEARPIPQSNSEKKSVAKRKTHGSVSARNQENRNRSSKIRKR
jgi:hypothetical protein